MIVRFEGCCACYDDSNDVVDSGASKDVVVTKRCKTVGITSAMSGYDKTYSRAALVVMPPLSQWHVTLMSRVTIALESMACHVA